jgi:hypothetical protein
MLHIIVLSDHFCPPNSGHAWDSDEISWLEWHPWQVPKPLEKFASLPKRWNKYLGTHRVIRMNLQTESVVHNRLIRSSPGSLDGPASRKHRRLQRLSSPEGCPCEMGHRRRIFFSRPTRALPGEGLSLPRLCRSLVGKPCVLNVLRSDLLGNSCRVCLKWQPKHPH